MSRSGSSSNERLELYGMELHKYDDDEGAHDGLLGADSSNRAGNGSCRRVQCSWIAVLLLLVALAFAVFRPSDKLRGYPNAVEDHCVCGTEPYGAALRSSYSAPALERSGLLGGTGARTRKFLDVARKRPVKVGILGRLISACHVVDTNAIGKSCYARHIVDWIFRLIRAGIRV